MDKINFISFTILVFVVTSCFRPIIESTEELYSLTPQPDDTAILTRGAPLGLLSISVDDLNIGDNMIRFKVQTFDGQSINGAEIRILKNDGGNIIRLGEVIASSNLEGKVYLKIEQDEAVVKRLSLYVIKDQYYPVKINIRI